MSPLELYELLQELKAEIPEINSAWIVVDDSQLIKNLGEKSRDDTLFLVGILPSYGTNGNSADAYKDTAVSQLMILDKTDYGDLKDDDLVALFERTYQVAKAVKLALLRIATEECRIYLSGLEVNSLDLDPVWKKAECNGWSLDLEIN